MSQLLKTVGVFLVMVSAFLVVLLILGFIERADFFSWLNPIVGVALVLTVASGIIIKIMGVDKRKK